MKKRLLALALAAAMVTVLFAGCGKKEEAPAEAPAAEAEEETEAAETEAEPVEEQEPEDYPENFMEERCGKFEFDSCDEIIANLEKGEAYGYAKVLGSDEDVLFITNEVFDGYDAPASIECYPYAKNEAGKYECKGILSSDSTSTPISVDAEGYIYDAKKTDIQIMAIDKNTLGLMCVKSFAVEYNTEDENDDEYTGFARTTNDVTEEAKDVEGDEAKAEFKVAFEALSKATPIAFTVVE